MRTRTILSALAVATILFALPAKSTAQNIMQPKIDVSTTVTREVTPDELYLSITINEKDYKGKKSLEEMQKTMIDVLKANKIDTKECLSLNYMGSDISKTTILKNIKLKSEATYTLKLHDVVTMQKVIAELEEKQISNIKLIKIKYTKEEEMKMELAVEAMQKAKAEAIVLAGAIEQEVGKALNIDYYMSRESDLPVMRKSIANEDAFASFCSIDEAVVQPEPQFNIGKITYNFRVNVKFELK